MTLRLLEVKSLVGHLIGWDTNPSEGLDASVRIVDKFNIGGTEIWLTQTVINTWIIMAVCLYS